MKTLLLSFDIEEFDVPLDYGIFISKYDQFKISHNGLIKILELLDELNIKSTFFVTYSFAKKYKNLIKNMSLQHEIGLHGYEHGDNYKKMPDILAYQKLKIAKFGIEKIIGKKIIGFRAPKLQGPKQSILTRLGFKYDSSLNPTFIPGKYNNFFSKRNIFLKEGIWIIPSSTTPITRFPLFWLTFRNFGCNLSLIISWLCLMGVNYVMLYFHPWEFVDLKQFKIPLLIKRNTGNKLFENLKKFIIKGKFKVTRFDEFYNKS